MKILLANPRGFCAGVEMAIDTVQELVDLIGTPLYVYHAIVHNRHVVERFENQGVTFVEDIADVPEGSTVVFSAHGVSPEVRQQSEARGLRMIDATCPLVTKVHVEARRYARMGKHILLVGHADHQEIKGTYGEAPEHMTIVESPDDVAALPFPPDTPLVYLTQTTLSLDDANLIIDAIKRKYPRCAAPPKEDICYATTNRQHAVRELAPQADLTIVIGSTNSSNSVRLTEISQNTGTPARLIDDATELQPEWFAGVDTVLITAGASAPDDLVRDVIRALRIRYDAVLDEPVVVDEGMSFALPVQLRVLKAEHSA
ncbi:MAG: 4-hydroxy-3-methylbut-2-enyl diphosphate reductase [Planctomycetota bacterium]